ncbi:60S acidic ribosomal protein P3-like [Thalictrum thalictroides]|uniref:60S acidic ribosomal protein P3-like n=1 Tax=Thalictrum thalictroides TaxID=46969 RepID=A0A7J6UX81_THATH|nr:60S acidic ribosomal protein P3-like [Thalictrum thalictroides]
MGVYTFVCRRSGSEWSAKQTSGGQIEVSASSAYDLQRKLVQAALSRDSGVVSSAFNLVTPSSAVFEVIVACSFVGGSAAPANSVTGNVAASVAPAAEEKKEELEESDEDISDLFT